MNSHLHLKKVAQGIGVSMYPEIIRLARENGYKLAGYGDTGNFDKFIIIRHDIDLDLNCALEMAELEARLDTRSTYFIMLHNEIYNASSPGGLAIIKRIRELGHTIGLHFDPVVRNPGSAEELVRFIHQEIGWMSSLIGSKVYYVSFHQPNQWVLNNDLGDECFESVYNAEYISRIRYIADSMGMWREESIEELIISGVSDRIQFVCHPALWMFEDATVQERLSRLSDFLAKGIPKKIAESVNNPSKNIVVFDPLAER